MKIPFFPLIISIFPCLFLSFPFLGCNKKNFHLEDQNMDYVAKALFDYSADILWIVDNSHSMQKHQERLIREMNSFLEALDNSGIHFHLGITSMDMRSNGGGGDLIGSPDILTSQVLQWKSLFKTRFLLGEDGSNNERGLDSIKALITQRKDFLRSQSPLILIVVTDEEDSSLGKVENYIQFLDKVKPPFKVDNSRTWQVHFFGILDEKDHGPHCALGKRIYPSRRYLNLVQISNGIAVSLCSPDLQFDQSLDKIKNRIVQFFTDYKLNQMPKEETIEVSINEQRLFESSTNGWLYHREGNFIRFYGEAVPHPNDKIKIFFSPAEARF